MDLEFGCSHIASYQTTSTKERMLAGNDFCFYASPFYASHGFLEPAVGLSVPSQHCCVQVRGRKRERRRKASKLWRGSEGCGQKSKQQRAPSVWLLCCFLLTRRCWKSNSQWPWAANQNKPLSGIWNQVSGTSVPLWRTFLTLYWMPLAVTFDIRTLTPPLTSEISFFVQRWIKSLKVQHHLFIWGNMQHSQDTIATL